MSLLTPDQVAAELGVSLRTVRRVLRELTVVRVGRCVRVERAELDRWIKDNPGASAKRIEDVIGFLKRERR